MGLMKGRRRTKVKHSWVMRTQKHVEHHRKHPVRAAQTGPRGVELRAVTQVRRSVHADASFGQRRAETALKQPDQREQVVPISGQMRGCRVNTACCYRWSWVSLKGL